MENIFEIFIRVLWDVGVPGLAIIGALVVVVIAAEILDPMSDKGGSHNGD